MLQLMCKGHSNAEIADILSITVDTTKTHVSVILGKLDAKNRTHAVAITLKGNITGGEHA